MIDNTRVTASFTQRVDYPWSITDRATQLLWWAKYGKEALRYVAVKEADMEVIHTRPPDRFFYAGEESHRSEHIERRHTFFSTWPVKVIVNTVYDHLGMTWELPDGRKVGVKIAVNRRAYTHEEDVAGA